MKHVSEQSWFAVWIDLIVVVAGIFLGLQASVWNESREDVQWERVFYQDLKGDLERDLQHLGMVLEFQGGKGDRLRALVQKLEGGNDISGDEFFDAKTGNDTFFPANGVYQSALSSGKIELIRNRPLRYRIMNLYGHHYSRFLYNGEHYDQRVETVAWDYRRFFDNTQRRFSRWDEDVKRDVRAEIAFSS